MEPLVTRDLLEDDEDEDGLDIFMPSQLEQERHLPSSFIKVASSKTTKCTAILSLAICGGITLVVIIGVAVGAAIEITKLKVLDNTSSPTSSPTPSPTPTDLEWWKKTVIYQIYPRSYQDSDGDGSGDINGILSRIDYLSDIGINTIWLNPIFASPQRDNGYDISNYTNVDPLFGDLEQLDLLLEDLHERDMHLLLDFVPNHTSDEHPWFIESRQDKSNPKRDWYVWADGKGDGVPPNNWISVFGGSAWTRDNLTNQWYLHQFSSFQPDLNYSNPNVRTATEDVLRFWLDRGVDGFRVDAVGHLLEDPALPDEPLNPNRGDGCLADCYGYLIHNYTRNYQGTHVIIRSWRQVMDSYSQTRKRFMVGEVYDPIDVVVSYYGDNDDEFHFPFNFLLLENDDWSGTSVGRKINLWLENMPEGGWPNWVLGNHDNHRIASKAGTYLARALNVLLLTLPGTPTSYYGDEILMTDVNVPSDRRQDLYDDRDRERTPMQWSNESNAGFTTGDDPWLPTADNFSVVNVKMEESDPTSILTLYKELITLRFSCQFLNTNYLPLLVTSDIIAYVRYCDAEDLRFLVMINFSEQQVNAVVNVTSKFPLSTEVHLSSNFNRTEETMSLGGPVMLLGGEALVLKGTYN